MAPTLDPFADSIELAGRGLVGAHQFSLFEVFQVDPCLKAWRKAQPCRPSL